MLISHRKNFIYTKTSKTAGTSVELYFEPFCLPAEDQKKWIFRESRKQHVCRDGIIGYRGSPSNRSGSEYFNHMPAIEIRNKIGNETWDSYFKFCVIRNPFDRMVSAFYFQKKLKRQKLKQSRSIIKRIGSLIQLNLSDFCTRQAKTIRLVEEFRGWVGSGRAEFFVDRNKYLIGEDLCIDYFIRHENLNEGIKHVCQVLDIPFESSRIPELKSGIRDQRIPIKEYYDQETIDIVSKVYEFEMNEFGYDAPK